MTMTKQKRAPRSKRDAEGLTDRERLFAMHYVGAAGRSGTRAYLMTGTTGNYNTAKRESHKFLQKLPVIQLIDRLTEERNERLNFTADDVLRELIVLKTDVEALGAKSAPALRTRLDVLKTIGEHVEVRAFRRQVGLSSPTGGPIQVEDLSHLSDEELEAVERAREILDRRSGSTGDASDPDAGGDPGGEGTPD
jgi:hypothetical protein